MKDFLGLITEFVMLLLLFSVCKIAMSFLLFPLTVEKSNSRVSSSRSFFNILILFRECTLSVFTIGVRSKNLCGNYFGKAIFVSGFMKHKLCLLKEIFKSVYLNNNLLGRVNCKRGHVFVFKHILI